VDNYVQDSVLKYEPHSALFAENHGLAIYEKILEDAHLILKEHFLMAFEISDEQEDALTLLIKKYFPQAKYEFKKDLNHFTRFLFIEA
jgi:release factor glutamine methyltransferase